MHNPVEQPLNSPKLTSVESKTNKSMSLNEETFFFFSVSGVDLLVQVCLKAF